VYTICDNPRTDCREFYDDSGKLVKAYAREVLDDEHFVKEFGRQIFWGYFPSPKFEDD
jgi:hypothetical protein